MYIYVSLDKNRVPESITIMNQIKDGYEYLVQPGEWLKETSHNKHCWQIPDKAVLQISQIVEYPNIPELEESK